MEPPDVSHLIISESFLAKDNYFQVSSIHKEKDFHH